MSNPTTRVLVGVTGGIAAYKSPDLVRRLKERGFDVRVVMTKGAQAFVTSLTLQAVSSHPVSTDLLDENAEAGMGHIELARWADWVVVAPATANVMARLSAGLADDLLSTLCLATAAPILIAPAMNQQMWAAAATQANLARLMEFGVHVAGPGVGDQACGDVGAGRMLEPLEIIAYLEALIVKPRLRGKTVLVTAGPTQEAIDPVRYVSNHSSGKMGYAVAAAARALGAKVTLISGPTALLAPRGVERINVISAADMYRAAMDNVSACDVFISAAAVADYRPALAETQKMKKHTEALSLALVPTQDILHGIGHLPEPPFTVGFAAETQNLEANATSKLQRKKLQLIAANRVDLPGIGFGVDENELTVYSSTGSEFLGRASKHVLAMRLMNLIADRCLEQN